MDRSPDFDDDPILDTFAPSADGSAPPPELPGHGGRRRPGEDHLLARSPWWAVPLLVSVVIGAERLLMLAFLPGWRAFGIEVFGAMFIVTFAIVLAAGGLYIGHYRR